MGVEWCLRCNFGNSVFKNTHYERNSQMHFSFNELIKNYWFVCYELTLCTKCNLQIVLVFAVCRVSMVLWLVKIKCAVHKRIKLCYVWKTLTTNIWCLLQLTNRNLVLFIMCSTTHHKNICSLKLQNICTHKIINVLYLILSLKHTSHIRLCAFR